MDKYTVFHDNGARHSFEVFYSRTEAQERVMELAALGLFAIITEDWPE